MSRLLPVEEARRRILAAVKPLAGEMVPLSRSCGRVLARDIKASRDQPPFAASAMDGYAVRCADISDVPTCLSVIAQAPAGHGFSGKVNAGETVRVFTGSPVPAGTDAVVIQENTRADGADINVLVQPRHGQFIRPRGLDFTKGNVVLRAGETLDSRRIGLAAAANRPSIRVRRKPVVAVLGTGDELVEPGQKPRPDQIVSSNNTAISAFIGQFGGEAKNLGLARDQIEDIEAAVRAAVEADVLITIGGASVGAHDLVRTALAKAGVRLDFWKIAMRPGKPLMFARRGHQRVLGLPGNPVSALVCARIFLKPLLDALLGRDFSDDESIPARLARPLKANDERQDYLRAKLWHDDAGHLMSEPLGTQDSSMQQTLAHADALIVRPPHAPAARKGARIKVLRIDF